MRRFGITVRRTGRGVDQGTVLLDTQFQEFFEGIEIGLQHDTLIIDRRIGDGRLMEDVIEVIGAETIPDSGVIKIAADDLSGKSYEVFKVTEAFKVPVFEGFTASEKVKNNNLCIRVMLLKIESKVAADKPGTPGDKDVFSVEICIAVLHIFLIGKVAVL